MIKQLRQNYSLSRVLVHALYVLCSILAMWHDVFSLLNAYIYCTPWIVLLVTVFCSFIVSLIVPFVTKLLLRLFRFYNVLYSEFSLIVLAFMAINNLLIGLAGIPNFFTPTYYIWQVCLVNFVISAICTLIFYKVTAKLYFNEVTRVHYFKIVSVLFLVLNFFSLLSNVLGG